MEFRGDIEKWDPMSDDYKDASFNSYRQAAALQGAPPNAVVRLFVAGIPPSLTETGLRNLMSDFADILVLDVVLIATKNIGFVAVRSKDAAKVIAYFNNYKLGDNYLTVKLSKDSKLKQTGNPPGGPAIGTSTKTTSASGEVEKSSHSSSTVYGDVEIPPLLYPSAAKYVQVGEKLAVKVLSVNSPSQFWISRHPNDAEEQLKELHGNLQKHYSEIPRKTGFKPNLSSHYAAYSSSSGNWFRAQTLKFDTKSVSLLWLDYGTFDEVGLTDLHSLEGQFCSLPFQAIQCSLAHIQGTPEHREVATEYMRQLVSSEQVFAKVCSIDGYLLSVELFQSSSSQSVNDLLVMKNYASYVEGFEPGSMQASTQSTALTTNQSDQGESSCVKGFEPSSIQACMQSTAVTTDKLDLVESSEESVTDYPIVEDLRRVQLTVGEQYDVVVLHAKNAGDVTVCLSSDVGKLGTLIGELNAYNLPDSYVPHVGEIVVAEYAVDSTCNRAEVLSVNNDNTATVLFLDFGNKATVSLKSVFQLQPRHIAVPVYGISVKFRSSDVDSGLLEDYCNLSLKVVEQRGSQYVVDLVQDDKEIQPAETESLSSQQTYSISDIKRCYLETGKTYKAWVTDAADLGKFYVQVREFDYMATNELLQRIYSRKSGGYEPQQIGELIAVHLNEDDTWCRAVVKQIDSNEAVKCQLLDFGMCMTVASKDIGRFDSRLLAYPVVGFGCSFYDAVASRLNSWKDDYLMPMTDLFNLTAVEVKGDVHSVELVHVETGVDWKQKLMSYGFLVKAESSDLQPVVSSTTVDKSPSDDAGHSAATKPGDSSHDSTTHSVSGSRQPQTKSIIMSEQVLASPSDTEVRQLLSNKERIVVVHANTPSDFYIQPGSDRAQKELRSLQEAVNKFCSQSSGKPDAVSVHQIVGVLHDDGVWYRGEVVNPESHGKFQVHFVDVGITKTAESVDLRSLPDALALSLPRRAIHCAIDRVVGSEPDGSWSVAAIEWFQKFCKNSDLTLKLIYKSDSDTSRIVDLIHVAARRTAKDMLLAQKLAVDRTKSSSRNNKSISQSPQVLPDVSRKEIKEKTSPVIMSSTVENASIQRDDTVMVTCINSPCNFFVQQQHQGSAEVLKELNSYCKEHDQVYRPKQVGELVSVMHDSQWNRAEVLSLHIHSAKVFLVDYGNTVDNVDAKNIRALPLHFATVLPKLAVRCAIGGITGTRPDGSYSEAASKWLIDYYLQVTSVVTRVKHTDLPGALLINLRSLTSAKTARQSLLDYEMALIPGAPDSAVSSLAQGSQVSVQPQIDVPRDIPQPSVKPMVTTHRERAAFEDAPELEEYAAVCVVHVNSPADFYVMPSEPAALHEFMLFSQELTEYCGTSNNEGYCPRYVGEPVAAKFEGEWFRAEVVKLMSNNCSEVFFVDYGNTAVVGTDDLRNLHEKFVKWPKRAVRCGIDGIHGAGSGRFFTEAATQWFKGFCCDSCATVSSVRIANRKHLINISVNDDGAKEHLIAAGFARSEV